MEIVALEPTILLRRQGARLAQLVDVVLLHDGAPVDAAVDVAWDGGHASQPLGRHQAGEGRYRFAVQELDRPSAVRIALEVDGAVRVERTVRWTPPRRWEVHPVHFSHHDWGYTDLPSNLWLEQDRIMETVLRYCGQTDGWPEESRFRYTVEQGWSLLHFLESHPERTDEVIRRYWSQGGRDRSREASAAV